MDDDSIRDKVRGAMSATAEALARKYNEDRVKLTEYVEDLLSRFANKGLGDTVARVGGDPLRKLAPGDRLTGAIDLCHEQDIDYNPILSGIAAAMQFDMPGDPSSSQLQERLRECNVIDFLCDYCGLTESVAKQCAGIYTTNSRQ